MTSLWLWPSCGLVGDHGLEGSKRTAMRYSSRSIVPVSRRTMNGTVLPWSVVVVATSGGGCAWSSVAPEKHVHGLIWGPARTGPPIGWFVIVSVAELPPGANAVTV